jgi:hypothetical protein
LYQEFSTSVKFEEAQHILKLYKQKRVGKIQTYKKHNFGTLQQAKCCVRAEGPNLEIENVIMCCLIRAVTYFRGLL